MENTELGARDIAEKSLRIAGQICIYTNDQITIEELKRLRCHARTNAGIRLRSNAAGCPTQWNRAGIWRFIYQERRKTRSWRWMS